MADNEIRNPAKAYFKWKMPVIAKSEDDWNFWNTEDKYNRTMFIGYNDLTTPHVASLFIIVDGKAIQAVGDDVLARIAQMEIDISTQMAEIQQLITQANEQQQSINTLKAEVQLVLQNCEAFANEAEIWAEGSDEDVASYGGEHSAKGWALRAGEIISTGLPSEASFDKLSVTGTIPSNDSSTRVPNTEWVQNAIQTGGGGVKPDSDITCKSISTTTGGADLVAEYSAERAETASIKVTPATKGTASSITLDVRTSNWEYPAQLYMSNTLMQATVPGRMEITVGDSDISPVDLFIGVRSTIATPWTHRLSCMLPIHANNGLYVKNRSTNESAFITTNTLDDDAETNPKLSVLGTLSVYGERTNTSGLKSSVAMLVHRAASDTDGSYVMLRAENSGSGLQSFMDLQEGETQLGTPLLTYFDKGDKSASTEAIRLGKASERAYSTKRYIYSELIGRFVNGLQIGLINDYEPDGVPFKVLRSDTTTSGKWLAAFGITPTVPDIADAADSSDKVPNTKWVQAAIAAGGGGGTSGAVTSVNGKTGEVVLSASDVGAASSSDLASYVTTDAMNTELANFATTASVDTKLADYQPKLIAGDGITISDSNVISATGGTGGGAVSSVNSKTGEVVLTASDVGAATADDITTALEPYAKTADVSASLADYAKSADVTTEIATATDGLQPKLTAGANITISEDNVISATGGGAVDSVNGKTGAVVLTGEDIKTDSTDEAATLTGAINAMGVMLPAGASSNNQLVDNASMTSAIESALTPYATTEALTAAVAPLATTASVNTALAGKQSTIVQDSELSLNSITLANSSTGEVGTLKLTSPDGKIEFRPSGAYLGGILGRSGEGMLIMGNDLHIGYQYSSPTGILVSRTDSKTTHNFATEFTNTVSCSADIAASDDSMQLATTKWVNAAIAAAGGGSGGGDVASVNGKTGTVVLTAEDITMGPSDTTTVKANSDAISALVLGKQDALTASSDVTVGTVTATGFETPADADGNTAVSITAESVVVSASMITLGKTGSYNPANGYWWFNEGMGANNMSTDSMTTSSLIAGSMTGGIWSNHTGAFDWYMNTTTDYNKFNIYSRYWTTTTDPDTKEETQTSTDTLIMSAGGSPIDHSTWVDFTANYLSFKGAANFGETGMASHTMNFNGASTFNASADFMSNVAFLMPDGEGGSTSAASFTASTGSFNITRVGSADKGTGDIRLAWDTDSRNTDTYGMHINMPVANTATMPEASDSSTTVPTTAWVQSAIAAAGGSVPENLSVKSLEVTEYDSGLNSIKFAGNLEYTGDAGNGSLGKITANEMTLQSPGYYSTHLRQSGIILSSAGTDWFNADSSTSKLTVHGNIDQHGILQQFGGMLIEAGTRYGTLDIKFGLNNTVCDMTLAGTSFLSINQYGQVFTSSTVDIMSDVGTQLANASSVKAAILGDRPSAAYSTSGSARQVIRTETCQDGSRLCTVYWHGPATNGTAISVTVPSTVANGVVMSVTITPETAGTAGASATLTDSTLSITPALAADGNVSITVIMYHEA